MKILFVGDFLTNTGPAIVNKNIYANSLDNLIFEKFDSKNLIKLYRGIKNNDKVLISGISKINLFVILFAGLLKKQSFYLMHGYAKYENEISNNHNFIEEKVEAFTLRFITKIICVSSNFSSFLKEKEKKYSNKITFTNNGVDYENIYFENEKKLNTDNFKIISVGGGRRIKNNLIVCKAIEIAREKKGKNIEFTVIGKLAEEGENIKKYSFVNYFESLSHEQVLEKMRESNLYIQNSILETFGLAPVEALFSGCSLLLSKNIGALSSLKIENKEFIIENIYDEIEITEKLINILLAPNNRIILNNLNIESLSWKRMVSDLIEIMKGKYNE